VVEKTGAVVTAQSGRGVGMHRAQLGEMVGGQLIDKVDHGYPVEPEGFFGVMQDMSQVKANNAASCSLMGRTSIIRDSRLSGGTNWRGLSFSKSA
jgi:hypothetical protein